MSKIFFDSIIFALQKNGGISNYWKELIDGIRDSGEFSAIYSNQDEIKKFNKLTRSFYRYCPVRVPDNSCIFHGSYYRTASGNNIKNVITVYDFMYEKFAFGIKRLIHVHQKYRAIKKADLIITISKSTKADLLNLYPQFKYKNISVIPLGVDNKKFFYNPANTTISYPEQTVLFVGGRRGYKRFDVAVTVVACLEKYKLGIVGQPLTADEIIFLNKNLGRRWCYYGKVSDDELSLIYKSVFCFIFPSCYEGFGLPLIEAQACGCPVIASQTSSLAEVGQGTVKYGNNLDINTYLREFKALENKKVRDHFIELGLENSKKYSWAKSVESTLSAYRTIC